MAWQAGTPTTWLWHKIAAGTESTCLSFMSRPGSCAGMAPHIPCHRSLLPEHLHTICRAALYMGHDQLCLVSTQAALHMAAMGLPAGHQPHSLAWAPDGQTVAVLSHTRAPSPAEASTFEHSVVVSFHAASGASVGTAALAAPVRMPSAASLQVRLNAPCAAWSGVGTPHRGVLIVWLLCSGHLMVAAWHSQVRSRCMCAALAPQQPGASRCLTITAPSTVRVR